MNKKGQIGMGTIIIAFTAIIVGVALFLVVAQQTGEITSTIEIANQSLGDADNDTTVYMTNIRAISDVVIYNESGDAIVPSSNYTVTNNVVNNGALAVSVLPASAAVNNYTGFEWTISGTAQPLNYIADGGSRSITGLIAIFFALAIALVAIEPVIRGELAAIFGK